MFRTFSSIPKSTIPKDATSSFPFFLSENEAMRRPPLLLLLLRSTRLPTKLEITKFSLDRVKERDFELERKKERKKEESYTDKEEIMQFCSSKQRNGKDNKYKQTKMRK